MPELIDDVRREVQRGVVLMILAHANLDWIPYSELRAELARGQGYPMTDSELWFHLRYLEARGLVETRRARPGRDDLAVMRVRGTPKAVDLLDGRVAADPGVAV